MKRLKNVLQQRHSGYVWQKGQAMIEYTVVTVFGILVLTTGPGRGVIEDLENAVRNNYDGFSYAVSLSDYPDKENYFELISMYNDQGMPSERREYLTDNPNDLIRELGSFALNSIPGVTEGLDMASGIGLSLDDFCDICSGNPFDAL
ncbi:MAG: hypothetical protein IIA99_06740 [Proteobacteria bacterium]|nr:hypothetical protein [Pseudomonadota bacterium]